MNLFNLAAKLTLDTGDYNGGLSRAESALSKFGQSAVKIGTAAATVLTAAAGGVAALTKQAVEAYSNYEQLTGGVETLFRSSLEDSDSVASKVLDNANKAFETAGMSANEYMETVTGMSASLIQSASRGEQQDLDALKQNLDEQYKETKRTLDDEYAAKKSYYDELIRLEKDKSKKQDLKEARDAELKQLKRANEDQLAEMKRHNKEVLAEAEASNMTSEVTDDSLQRAADLADMAIRDMSDNANKIGTDIESIKNAYGGFAKGQFTMLDNLKLGYGGTQAEMERLLQDAERLTGKSYDISSYADIVEAIHAIQTEMGISGLSAEEAAEMVEQGLLTEEEAYEKMGTTAKEAQTTIEGSSKAMKAAWQNMLVTFADPKGNTKKATQNLVRTAKTFYKNISPVITQAISGIGDFLLEVAPMVGEELPKIIADIAPKLFSAGVNLVKGLAKGVMSAIGKIQWPSWEDVKSAAISAWDTITTAVENLGGLIFGKNEDGTVNWPSWEDIVATAESLWNDIVAFVAELPKTLGSLIFGNNDDGSVKWPSWEDITAAASKLWEDIKTHVANFAGLIFGKNKDGSVNFPRWKDVKGSIIASWEWIKTNARKLTGFVLGDVSDASSLISAIEEKWKTLRATIEEKAINIGTYFFGEGNAESVTAAIKAILDVLTALGAGIGTYMMVKNFEKIISTLRSFFTLDLSGTSKIGIILAGIATAFMLIYENWDKIQPVLLEAWTWIDTNVIQPMAKFFADLKEWVTGAIKDIKRFLGIRIDGELTNGEAVDLVNQYMDYQHKKDVSYDPNEDEDVKNAEDTFYDSLNEKLTNAGIAADEIEKITQKIKESDDPKWVADFIQKLTNAETKAQALDDTIDISSKVVDTAAGNVSNAFGALVSAANAAAQALANIDSPGGSSYIGGSGRNWRTMPTVESHAKGAWDIPYDDYLANLHRGEMVLTASQARRYREGEGNGVDLAGLEDRIESAIRRGMENAQVRSYLNGKDITDEVNRNNIQAVKGRRFAT